MLLWQQLLAKSLKTVQDLSVLHMYMSSTFCCKAAQRGITLTKEKKLDTLSHKTSFVASHYLNWHFIITR